MTTGPSRHLSAHEVWPALIAVTAVAGVTAAVSAALTARGSLSSWWIPVASIAPALVTVLPARTLAGNDVTLEQSQPRTRTTLYAAHALGLITVSTLTAAAVGPTLLDSNGGSAMIRNSLGLAGLILASAAVLRTAATWIPVTGYTVLFSWLHPENRGAPRLVGLARPARQQRGIMERRRSPASGWSDCLRPPRTEGMTEAPLAHHHALCQLITFVPGLILTAMSNVFSLALI